MARWKTVRTRTTHTRSSTMKKQIDPVQVSRDYIKNATLSQLTALERFISCYKEIRQEEKIKERQKTREYLRSR